MATRPANGVVVITADMSFIPFAGVRVCDCLAICCRSTAQMKSVTSADARVWTRSRVLFIARCVTWLDPTNTAFRAHASPLRMRFQYIAGSPYRLSSHMSRRS